MRDAKSPLSRLIGPSLALLALASCAVLPDRTPAADARAPDSFMSAKSFAAPEAAWPGATWWQAYNDPQLNALIDEGLKNSPTLAVAEARVRAANAAVDFTRGRAGPQVDLNAGVQEQKQS